MMLRRKRYYPWHHRPLRARASQGTRAKEKISVIYPNKDLRRSLFLLRSCGFAFIIVVMILLYRKEHEDDAEVVSSQHRFVIAVNESKVVLERPGYWVWTPSCMIPEREAFDKSIRRFLKPPKSITYSDKPPLTYVAPEMESEEGEYVLHINESLISSYITSRENVSCCYSNITLSRKIAGQDFDKNVDNKIDISVCANFKKKVKLLPEEEFLLVRCKKKKLRRKEESEEMYINIHGVVPIKQIVKEKRRKRKTPNDDDWLNVLIIGYDNISQLNLIRSMPATVQYLHEAGFVNLHGYNIVGNASFPNIVALLTGLNTPLFRQECRPSAKLKIDECPFVWKEFNKYGYVTAYIEDRKLSTFNYESLGFEEPPTDYYFRPYILGADKYIPKKNIYGSDACFGPESTTEHIMKYLLKYVSTLRNYLHFALVWMNNLCHDDANGSQALDKRTVQLFQDLNKNNVYNNTLIIFMSDHGARFGKIRGTFQGWLEEKLPYAYFLFPEWYRRKYAHLYENLLTNRRRLTSNYDIYLTLNDVLRISQKKKFDNPNVSRGCSHCVSLFSKDLGDRSCEDAGITPEFCTCNLKLLEISKNDKNIIEAIKFIMRNIKRRFNNNPEAQQCSPLTLKQVVKANLKLNAIQYNLNHAHEYIITFETEPGGALFESSVKYFIYRKKFSIVGPIQRINSYGKLSECVDNPELKLYCYCKNITNH